MGINLVCVFATFYAALSFIVFVGGGGEGRAVSTSVTVAGGNMCVSLTQHSSAPVITMTYVSTYQPTLSTQFYKSKVGNGVMHIHKTG
jgi:hypothetical protein